LHHFNFSTVLEKFGVSRGLILAEYGC
jgi:hypothetical protein